MSSSTAPAKNKPGLSAEPRHRDCNLQPYRQCTGLSSTSAISTRREEQLWLSSESGDDHYRWKGWTRIQSENHVFDWEPEDDLLQLLVACQCLTLTLKTYFPFKIIVKEVCGSSVHTLARSNTDRRSTLSISAFKQRHTLASSYLLGNGGKGARRRRKIPSHPSHIYILLNSRRITYCICMGEGGE